VAAVAARYRRDLTGYFPAILLSPISLGINSSNLISLGVTLTVSRHLKPVGIYVYPRLRRLTCSVMHDTCLLRKARMPDSLDSTNRVIFFVKGNLITANSSRDLRTLKPSWSHCVWSEGSIAFPVALYCDDTSQHNPQQDWKSDQLLLKKTLKRRSEIRFTVDIHFEICQRTVAARSLRSRCFWGFKFFIDFYHSSAPGKRTWASFIDAESFIQTAYRWLLVCLFLPDLSETVFIDPSDRKSKLVHRSVPR